MKTSLFGELQDIRHRYDKVSEFSPTSRFLESISKHPAVIYELHSNVLKITNHFGNHHDFIEFAKPLSSSRDKKGKEITD